MRLTILKALALIHKRIELHSIYIVMYHVYVLRKTMNKRAHSTTIRMYKSET